MEGVICLFPDSRERLGGCFFSSQEKLRCAALAGLCSKIGFSFGLREERLPQKVSRHLQCPDDLLEKKLHHNLVQLIKQGAKESDLPFKYI